MKNKLLSFTFHIIGFLPLWVLHSLGNIFGVLLFFLPIKLRYRISRNVELCFPNYSFLRCQWLVFCNCRELCKGIFEAPVFWVRKRASLLRLIKYHDSAELLSQSLQQEKALIVLGLHLGAYYLNRAVLAKYLPSIVNLYKKPKGAVGEYITKHRNDFGGEMVEANQNGIMQLYRRLKQGGAAGITCDHTANENGYVWTTLFGIELPAMGVPAKLAGKTGAPVYMTIIERLSWARGYRFHCWQVGDDIYSSKQEEAARAMCQEIEKAVRQWPKQFEWHYRRFRHSKVDGRSPYKR